MKFIEPEKSEWAFEIFLAPKKDRSLRFFIDYGRLNAITILDSHLILIMNYFIDSHGNAEILSKLDANSGHWKIEIDARDLEKT